MGRFAAFISIVFVLAAETLSAQTVTCGSTGDEQTRLTCQMRSLSHQLRDQLRTIHNLTPSQMKNLVNVQSQLINNELGALQGNLTTNQIRAAVGQMRHDLQVLQNGGTGSTIALLQSSNLHNEAPADLFPPINNPPAKIPAVSRSTASIEPPQVLPPPVVVIHEQSSGTGAAQ